MKKVLFLMICVGFTCASAFSQPYEYKQSTGHSGTGANIDVKYHRLSLDINPDNSKRISGNVATYFVTTQNNVNRITFDLVESSFNNSNLHVYYHGSEVTTSFPTSGNRDILRINLPGSLSEGTLDSVTIFYNGVPLTGGSAPGGCFQTTIYGYPLFYTLSESYEDKDWWPCKADMQDKIDSTDINVTTPSKYRAAVIGKLVSETSSEGYTTYQFRHRYPVASYLISVAVSQYNVYDRGTININGTEMPVMYYITKGRNPSNSDLNKMDYCKDELIAFGSVFGDYPYKNEKYGMYEFGFGGGMEHQTFSGMSYGAMKNWSVVAHELMHQWFGDKVSAATWNHLWLSEGFASYGEALAAELIPAIGANPTSVMSSNKNDAINRKNYGCVIPDSYIVNSATLWNSNYGSTVYSRGGMCVSMLRILVGDTEFFQGLRNYLNDPQLAYGSATTEDLRAHMEAVCGYDLSGFFNSFVYGNGYPSYSGSSAIKWDAIGSGRIRFRVSGQSQSTGSNQSHYDVPIPLRVQGAGGKDTIIVLFDQGSTGVSIGGDGITFNNSPTPTVYLGFTPTSVSLDPYSMSLVTGSTLKTTVLASTISGFKVNVIDGKNVANIIFSDYSSVSDVILESSNDGTNFSSIEMMAHKGNGSFSLNDASHSQTVYYRAKVTNNTGEILYSKIVRIAGNPFGIGISLANNPVQHILKIKIAEQLNNKNIHFAIVDMLGRTLIQTNKTVHPGIMSIDVQKLMKGNYLLHIQSGTNKETIQFIIN